MKWDQNTTINDQSVDENNQSSIQWTQTNPISQKRKMFISKKRPVGSSYSPNKSFQRRGLALKNNNTTFLNTTEEHLDTQTWSTLQSNLLTDKNLEDGENLNVKIESSFLLIS